MTDYLALEEKGISVTRNLTTELIISEKDVRRIVLEAVGAPHDAMVQYDAGQTFWSEVSVKWTASE